MAPEPEAESFSATYTVTEFGTKGQWLRTWEMEVSQEENRTEWQRDSGAHGTVFWEDRQPVATETISSTDYLKQERHSAVDRWLTMAPNDEFGEEYLIWPNLPEILENLAALDLIELEDQVATYQCDFDCLGDTYRLSVQNWPNEAFLETDYLQIRWSNITMVGDLETKPAGDPPRTPSSCAPVICGELFGFSFENAYQKMLQNQEFVAWVGTSAPQFSTLLVRNGTDRNVVLGQPVLEVYQTLWYVVGTNHVEWRVWEFSEIQDINGRQELAPEEFQVRGTQVLPPQPEPHNLAVGDLSNAKVSRASPTSIFIISKPVEEFSEFNGVYLGVGWNEEQVRFDQETGKLLFQFGEK